MDQTEATTKNLKNITKDVLKCLIERSEEFKSSIKKFKENYFNKINKFSADEAVLRSTLENEKIIEENLSSKILLIKKSLEKEEADITKLDSENDILKDQIKELENTNKFLLEKLIDIEEKEKHLKSKCKQLRDRKENKIKEQKLINNLFKLYFGLDIIKLKEDVIKIIFYNLGCECYVIIDFSQNESVSECHPQINLEKVNYAFKEKKNFYEFIKFIREQLKQNI